MDEISTTWIGDQRPEGVLVASDCAGRQWHSALALRAHALLPLDTSDEVRLGSPVRVFFGCTSSKQSFRLQDWCHITACKIPDLLRKHQAFADGVIECDTVTRVASWARSTCEAIQQLQRP